MKFPEGCPYIESNAPQWLQTMVDAYEALQRENERLRAALGGNERA